ncbi:MAG TPA: PQQ-dependent dehydrogenase, methanol/ethanol family [Bryobacteraceae bacterium]|nr:PQQ-dependent dehydrogenase, methanol/ethanol family [Bryobacteraceae bacterium]
MFAGWLAGQSDRAEAQKNPFAGQAAAIAAGRTLYDAQCQSCHAQGFANYQHGSEDGEIFLNIRNGIRSTTMPAYTQLSTDQIWQIVSYMRTLNAGGGAPATVSSEAGGGDTAAGKAVFEGKGGCLSCHQFNGKGTPVGPDLTFTALNADQIAAFITNPNAPPAAAGGGGGRGRGRGFGRGGGAAARATVIATTADGKVYKGTRKSQDSFTIQMVDTNGVFRSFDRAALKDLKIDMTSLMPADFSTRLSAAEIHDVAAYLKGAADPAAPADPAHAVLTWNRILNAAKEPANWTTYWGDLAGTHYSALNEITSANAKNLQAQWMTPIPGEGQIQATPLVVDGILYTTGPIGAANAGSTQVLAMDAKTGKVLWRYDRPQKVRNPYENNRVNRGVSILDNRVFVGTLDAALVALDAHTGKQLWEVQLADTKEGYEVTCPPLVVKDKIITGISGGEFGIRGFLEAYDPATGKKLWHWNAIPGPGEFGNDTWEGDSWQHGSGGTWLTGVYDPSLNLVYWTVGNPGPVINGDVRKGDDLFTASVVAIDPDTGQRKWHYQFTPNDTHDWDSTEDTILVDRQWHGQARKLMLHADRNGVFYVLDRVTGKLLSATPFVRATWVKEWDANGRPVFADNWRASAEGVTVYPSLGGGTNFQAPSYSAKTGWFYVVYHDSPGNYSEGPQTYEAGRQYQGRGNGGGFGPPPAGGQPNTQGVMAIDPETGKSQWKFELTQEALPPGVLATAGNVVFAATTEGYLIALDAVNGKLLWKYNTGAPLAASPISYAVDGRQYVAISGTGGLFTFALPR